MLRSNLTGFLNRQRPFIRANVLRAQGHVTVNGKRAATRARSAEPSQQKFL
jgi:hypothetical protein